MVFEHLDSDTPGVGYVDRAEIEKYYHVTDDSRSSFG